MIRVNHDKTARDHQYPQISVAPNGRVDVAWHDWRNDTLFNPAGTRSNQLYWDIYYSYSNDGGLTWADDIRMSDRSMNKNEGYSFHSNYGLGGPAGIASTDTAALVAWGDSRRGSVQLPVEDYYFAEAVHDREALEGGAAGGDDNTARDVVLGSVVTLVVAGLVLLIAARVSAGARNRARSRRPRSRRDRLQAGGASPRPAAAFALLPLFAGGATAAGTVRLTKPVQSTQGDVDRRGPTRRHPSPSIPRTR